jgi:hypothetical protein
METCLVKYLKSDELHVLQPGWYSTPYTAHPRYTSTYSVDPCPFTHALSQNKPHEHLAVAVKVMVKSFDTEMLQSSSD